MRLQIMNLRGPALLAAVAAVLTAKASAQTCAFSITSQPSSQIITNNSGDSFQTVLSFSVTETSTNSSQPEFFNQFRKGGAGFGDFGPWVLTKSGSGSGGWFTGNSNGNGGGDTNNDIGYSWGLWANGGELVNASRMLSPTNSLGADYAAYSSVPQLLPVGVTLHLDMDNGYVTSNSSVGVSIQNAEGQNLWEWYFPGGASTYSYHDNSGYNSSTLGWTAQGMHIAFTLTSTNTYTATVTALASGGGSFTVSGSLISESDPGVAQVRAFNNSAGTGSGYDFFVNNISIFDKADNAFTSTYLSPRSWVSGDGSGWDLHNGAHSGFFLGDSTKNGGGAPAGSDNINEYGPIEPPFAANCWGIFANSGDVADAIRPFGQPVYVNNQVVLTMDNGYVDNGSVVGLGLQSGATNRFEFYFVGGNTNYSINDSINARNTGIPWTDQGLALTFTLTSTNTYSLAVISNPGGSPPGTNYIITGTLEGATNSLIDRVRLFNASAGSDSTHDLYFSLVAVGESVSNQDAYECATNYDCAANTKYDMSGLYDTGWTSGQDNGYSVINVGFLPDGFGPFQNTVGTIFLTGGKELEGCWDGPVSAYNGTLCRSNTAPWYVQVH